MNSASQKYGIKFGILDNIKKNLRQVDFYYKMRKLRGDVAYFG